MRSIISSVDEVSSPDSLSVQFKAIADRVTNALLYKGALDEHVRSSLQPDVGP